MKISTVAKDGDCIEIILEGEDHSFPNMLRETLSEDSDVEFVAYNISHPQLAAPKLIVRTNGKKKPEKAVTDALKKIRKKITDFRNALEKEKEEKTKKEHKEKKRNK